MKSINLDNIPQALRERNQFVMWKNVERNGEVAKLPFQLNGRAAKSNDASTWGEYEKAVSNYICGSWAGIGYVFSENDGFTGIDLDGCRDPETSEIAPWAQQIIDAFGTYIEVSPSETGVKMFCIGKNPLPCGKNLKISETPVVPGKKPGVEIYDRLRYFAVTGWKLDGKPAEPQECQKQIDEFCAKFWPSKPAPDYRSNGSAGSSVLDRARKYLAKMPPAISGQNGSGRAFNTACVLVLGFDLSSEAAFPLYAEWNQTCEPPWSESEMRHKLEDASHQPGERGQLLNSENNNQRKKPDDPDDGLIRNGFIQNKKLCPVSMQSIISRINKASGDWPRRVGSALFVHEDEGIDFLERPSALFGYVGTKSSKPAKFLIEPGLHTKAEVFAEIQRTAQAYEAVEELPHEPKLPGHYYACQFPEPGNGDHLKQLVNRFNPETEIDFDLIKAFFISIFWGGAGGTKPAFLFDSPDGRGSGKTTIATTGGYLGNGHVELSANESAEIIKQRLLSPEGFTRRVALLDNVKSLRFSWSELEALITASIISGKRLYVGEARRPNNLVWCITLNGASLSTDLAQRCIIIRIKRPKHSGTWLEDTRKYIDDHRQQIIGDIIGFLRSERHSLEQYSRWGAWERDVLERLPEPAEAQAVILERQGQADIEVEESEILEDFIQKQLNQFDYRPDEDRVFIPSSILCRWFNDATNDRMKTQSVSRVVKQKITEGKLPHIVVCPHRSHGRGFEWIGDKWDNESNVLTDLESRIEIISGRYRS